MPSFRTKRGRCHLDGDTLRLESSVRSQFRRYREGGLGPTLLLCGALLSSAVILVTQLLAGDWRPLLFGVGAFLVLWVTGRVSNVLRGFTSATEISLDDIDHVTAMPGTSGFTRPRFVVAYDVAGETKRRYVMMPSRWLSYGDAEFERAKETFRDAGIDVETD